MVQVVVHPTEKASRSEIQIHVMGVDHKGLPTARASEEEGNIANGRRGSMDMDNIVLIDAAKQLRKLEDETAKPYFAEHKPPHLGVGKNIDVVSALLKAVLEVSNSARNTAAHRRSLRCHHEDAE